MQEGKESYFLALRHIIACVFVCDDYSPLPFLLRFLLFLSSAAVSSAPVLVSMFFFLAKRLMAVFCFGIDGSRRID